MESCNDQPSIESRGLTEHRDKIEGNAECRQGSRCKHMLQRVDTLLASHTAAVRARLREEAQSSAMWLACPTFSIPSFGLSCSVSRCTGGDQSVIGYAFWIQKTYGYLSSLRFMRQSRETDGPICLFFPQTWKRLVRPSKGK